MIPDKILYWYTGDSKYKNDETKDIEPRTTSGSFNSLLRPGLRIEWLKTMGLSQKEAEKAAENYVKKHKDDPIDEEEL